MKLSTADVSALLQKELERFVVAGTLEAFSKLLCPPEFEERTWDWNHNQAVSVWVIARANSECLLFVYSRDGYEDPWGCLSSTDRLLGMNSQWCAFLEDAFITSGAWKGAVPPGFAVR